MSNRYSEWPNGNYEEWLNNPDNIIPHDDGCDMYLEPEVATLAPDPSWQKYVL